MPREKSEGVTFSLGRRGQSRLASAVLALAVGIAYFMAARLGLALLASTGTSVFWPAAGISVAALIVCGPGARFSVAAGVVVATIVSNLMIGRSTGLALAFAMVNAGQALLTTALIERWLGRSFKLGGVSHVLGFLLASAIGSALAATGAAIVVALLESKVPVLTFWRVWFGSCLLGIVAVAPPLVGIAEALRHVPPRAELLEGVAGLSMLGALSAIAIALPQGPWSTALPLAIVFPVLLWIAVRCRPAFAAASAFFVASTVVGSITIGIGHFGDAAIPLADRVLAAQTIVLTGAVLTLVLAALFAERRRIEFVLERSNRRLQLALDGAELGAFSADLATGRLEWDARAGLIHGQTVQATTISESRRFVHPDDLGRLDAVFCQARYAGGIWSTEYRVVHPPGHHRHAGETRWVAVEGSIVHDPENTGVGLLGVTRDITERKIAQQAAERLVSIVESSEDAIISKDISGIIQSWNRGAERMFGYSAEEIIGKTISILIPDDRRHEERTILERVRRGKRVSHYETVRCHKDGTLIDVSLTVSPLRDAAGAVVGAYKIARDIGARKRAQEHQRTLNAELDHRAKNVLATVRAVIDQTRTASSSIADFVTSVDRRIDSLARTHDLLSESGWRGGSLVEIARRQFAPYAADNVHVSGPCVTLKADATQAVSMVLHELATNAAKYGAFSCRSGRVVLRWSWTDHRWRRRLAIDWQEINGPPVVAPSHCGYGATTIRELIPFELGGAVDLAFVADGVRCRIEIPATWVHTGRCKSSTPIRSAPAQELTLPLNLKHPS